MFLLKIKNKKVVSYFYFFLGYVFSFGWKLFSTKILHPSENIGEDNS